MAHRMEGQRILLYTGIALNIFSLVNLIISFATPYWVISWPRVFSPVRKVGLWEVCFAGKIMDGDPTLKSYYGCWWILAPELYAIRNWIMPPWFIVVQIQIVASLLAEIVALLFSWRVWWRTGDTDKAGLGKRRAPFRIVQAMTYITIITGVNKSLMVVLFGLGFRFDYFWLPTPELNYPSFSYGLAIVSAFVSIFSSFAHVNYRNIVRKAYHQPAQGEGALDLPPPPPLMMYKM